MQNSRPALTPGAGEPAECYHRQAGDGQVQYAPQEGGESTAHKVMYKAGQFIDLFDISLSPRYGSRTLHAALTKMEAGEGEEARLLDRSG